LRTRPPQRQALLSYCLSQQRWREQMRLPLTGGCRCGGLRYEIARVPSMLYTCPCTDCQPFTSNAFSLAMLVGAQTFHLTGEPRAMHIPPTAGTKKAVDVPRRRRVGVQWHEARITKSTHPCCAWNLGRHLLDTSNCALLNAEQTGVSRAAR